MNSPQTIVTTCTRDCPNTCGLMATVQDGRLAGLKGNPDHPLTKGLICAKTARYAQRVYHPERVTTPLVRLRGKDGERAGWRRAEWDEVLDRIAGRIKTILAESGPEAILYYQGYGERTALKLLNKRFFNLLGGVTTLRGSLCSGTAFAAQNMDLGTRISHDPLDHLNSGSIILWGRNPVSTNISHVPTLRAIRQRGGRVLLIDPIRTRSAAMADSHIAPRPGADAFLAMAAAKLVLAENKQDHAFLLDHTQGIAGYKAFLDRYTVEELCAMAGVDPKDARTVAHTMLNHQPTAILLGWGLHRHTNAHHTVRAIDALAALCGTLGVPGGGVSQGYEEYGPYDQNLWGDELHPPRRTVLLPRLGQELLDAENPAIRMIMVTAANPLCTAPDSATVAKGFRKAEFVVYSGHFLDDTADEADVFLPATTFLEEEDVMASYGHNYVGPVNPAIAPVGKCRSEFWMFQELAKRFDFGGEYRRSPQDWLADLCAPITAQGCGPEQLRRGPFRLDEPMVPYQGGIFPTPSGKFQFMPGFEPDELLGQAPGYPYRLLTVAPHDYIVSERTLADHAPLPLVRLNSAEARRQGLADNQVVTVQSQTGSLRARLRADPDLRPDVLAAERGGWNKAGHGLNVLAKGEPSAVGQGTPFYQTAVRVLPCQEPQVRPRSILVVQLSSQVPGGCFTAELERLGARLVVARPGQGEALPNSPEDFDGLLVLGGPEALQDKTAGNFRNQAQALARLMWTFDAMGRPVAGIGKGAQLLARAHGVHTEEPPWVEIGFAELEPTAEGRADPVLGQALPLPPVMLLQPGGYSLPQQAKRLVNGQSGRSQCFLVGKASYGFHFHLEADATAMAGWIDVFAGQEAAIQADLHTLREEIPLHLARSREFCHRVAANWLALANGCKA